ncbi:hypothetical protein EVA_10838 [gut metagenome]|uniref:Uncharacterized protein n=1 Tax=gut metagenome TaxID=749906 RepID=J9G1J0_9ZZZZ
MSLEKDLTHAPSFFRKSFHGFTAQPTGYYFVREFCDVIS